MWGGGLLQGKSLEDWLESACDISPKALVKFLQGVHGFYSYMKAKFPLNDDVLLHARVVNFSTCDSSNFQSLMWNTYAMAQ